MNSPDRPFFIIGGETEQSALANRINAIRRIEYLAGIDLHSKPTWYFHFLDTQMYRRWYHRELPNKKLDEEFCQRAAIIVKEMEKDLSLLESRKEEILRDFKEEQYNYRERVAKESKVAKTTVSAPKKGIVENIARKLNQLKWRIKNAYQIRRITR